MKFAWLPTRVYTMGKTIMGWYNVKPDGWAWLCYIQPTEINKRIYYTRIVKDYK
jgi:hypothetical protein